MRALSQPSEPYIGFEPASQFVHTDKPVPATLSCERQSLGTKRVYQYCELDLGKDLCNKRMKEEGEETCDEIDSELLRKEVALAREYTQRRRHMIRSKTKLQESISKQKALYSNELWKVQEAEVEGVDQVPAYSDCL